MTSGAIWSVVVSVLVGTFLSFELPAVRRKVPWTTLSDVVWTWPYRARLALVLALVGFALDLGNHFLNHATLIPGVG